MRQIAVPDNKSKASLINNKIFQPYSLLRSVNTAFFKGENGMFSKKYKLNFDGDDFAYKNVKSGYKEGENVTVYFDMIATDTNYSFFVDDELINPGYETSLGYIISFKMPAHDVKIKCISQNSMLKI